MSVKLTDHRSWLAAGVAATVAAAGLTVAATGSAQAATGCQVSYTITNQWPGGFGANVGVTNLGGAISGWTLTWSFADGQTITDLWDGTSTQSGANVSVTNASYNGAVPAGSSTSFGFNGSWNNVANAVPTSFALNGTPCTGSVTSPSTSPSSSPTPTSTGTGR